MENDFPLPGGAADPMSMILQAISGGAKPMSFTPPNLAPVAPMFSPDVMRQLVGQAMQPGGAPIQPMDKSMALAKIGLALMQPRQQGQSVAGSVGQAMNTGVDALGAAKAKAQQEAVQRAQMASTMASADLQRQQVAQGMEIARVNFPLQFARMQEELNNAQMQGDVLRVQAIEARLAALPEEMARRQASKRETEAAALAKTQAETAKTQAETLRLPAQAEEDRARAEYLRAQAAEGKRPVQQKFTDDKGNIILTTTIGDKTYVEQITPPITDAAVAQATAQKQLEEETYRGRGWLDRMSTPAPSKAEVTQRAQELMKGRRQWIGEPMPVRAKAAAAKPAATPGEAAFRENVANETPEQRRELAAGSQLAKLETELETTTDPVERAAIQKEMKRLQEIATSANPYAVARAKNPASVKKELQKNAAGDIVLTGKPGDVRKADAAAPKPAVKEDSEPPLARATRERREADKAFVSGIKSTLSDMGTEQQERQIAALKVKMKEGTLTSQEKAMVRRLAMDRPDLLSDEELKAAGVPLPPKKKK